MQQEIEAKFLNVDHDVIRTKLMKAGATLEHPMRLMRRVMLDYPDHRFQVSNQSKRLRIRDEGDKVTVTFKESNESNYAHEVETIVSSFEEMCDVFKAIGFGTYSYQESKRETWQYSNVEVVLDEWPWLETYIEIEGPDEVSIQLAAKDLGFNWEDAEFGSVDSAYRIQYKKMTETESIGNVAEVKFDMPVPQYFKDRI